MLNIKLKGIIFLILATCLSIGTLIVSPLPWFDEVIFADITKSFAEGRLFEAQLAPPIYDETRQVYVYGPMFFALSSVFHFFLGTTELSVRIPSLLFGLGVLVIIYFLLRSRQSWLSLFLICFLSIDLMFISGSHGGRMDTMAMFFWLSGALWQFRLFHANKKSVLSHLVIGLLFSLGYLTTPRSLLIYGGLGLIILFFQFRTFPRKDAFYHMVALIASFSIPILWWMLWAFGSLTDMIEYFEYMSNGYIGTKMSVPTLQLPLIVGTGLILAYTWYRKPEAIGKMIRTPEFVFYIVSIISFYVFIVDNGGYSIFIIPFYYLILFGVLDIWVNHQYIKRMVTIALLVASVPALAKYTLVLADQRWAKREQMFEFVADNVEPGSLVVGDEVYYYGVHNANASFQMITNFMPDSARESYQRNMYNYNYLFISQRLVSEQPQLFKLYESKSRLIPVDTLTFNSKIATLPLVDKLRTRIHSSYDGVLYKRRSSELNP